VAARDPWTALAKASRKSSASRRSGARLASGTREEEADEAASPELSASTSSTGFERWLLEEAFRRLVTGATRSSTSFRAASTLRVHDRLNFEVVDQERRQRSARRFREARRSSLLALALTLAEQRSSCGRRSARLESLFLDEGFGTLDDETLDVVGSPSPSSAHGARRRRRDPPAEPRRHHPVQYRVSRTR
jgi:exonuclease SbcC